jgi:hypothetical protein
MLNVLFVAQAFSERLPTLHVDLSRVLHYTHRYKGSQAQCLYPTEV